MGPTLTAHSSRARARSRSRFASIVICLSVAAAFMTSSVEAGERRVTLGEVSSRVVRTGVDFESIVRTASEEELRAVDLSRVPRGKRVIVSVALVRLDTLGAPPAIDTTCEVSATLRDARGGTVFAILEGKARAKSGGAPVAVESSAVHGALHGALARIPEVLRR